METPNETLYIITVIDHTAWRPPTWRSDSSCVGIFKHFLQANYMLQKHVDNPPGKYAVIEEYYYGLITNICSRVVQSWWYVWRPNLHQFEFIDYIPDEFKPGAKLYRESYGVS
jgi:hypothetical protein